MDQLNDSLCDNRKISDKEECIITALMYET